MGAAVHVTTNLRGQWCVRRGGSKRALRCFDRHDRAVSFGISISDRDGVPCYAHRRDGTIEWVLR